ncbi:hypothetical protein DY000_02039983 [Brassica cretica]|uniref:Uncharacterized protein n=1 Tax=Brassica cretica TaxID=69181 RepID=A0ABQ7B9R0_BRACR|nr:hypothetical protein DY000_02039983 [Brassica cretica]
MGHDQGYGLRRVKALNEHASSRRRLRRTGDRGTVAKNTGAAHYKKRSMHKKEDTLKSLERATPILRPCFHLVLAFDLIDLVL